MNSIYDQLIQTLDEGEDDEGREKAQHRNTQTRHKTVKDQHYQQRYHL